MMTKVDACKAKKCHLFSCLNQEKPIKVHF